MSAGTWASPAPAASRPSGRRRFAEALARPVDPASLVAFRVILGMLLAVSAVRFVAHGWVERFFVEPTFFFHYWGFEWVEVWPRWGMYLHFGLLAVAGLCIAAGLLYRLAAAVAFVAFTYLELMDVTNYLNHYYLLSLLLLLAAVMPLHRAGSLDVRRRPALRREGLPVWCVWLLRAQLAVVYFYAGLAKAGSDWLLHAQPLDIWLSARSDMPLLGPLFEMRHTAVAMSWAGFLYDLTIWIWLLWRPTRPYAFAVVIAFHTLVGLLFDIGMFPYIMTLSVLMFFSPSWPRRLLGAVGARLGRDWKLASPPKLRTGGTLSPHWRPALALGVAFLAVQVLVPLRHFAYPGNVLWGEQGMRWSWKVMVREKNAHLRYRVVHPDGRRQIDFPRRYLADFQEREISTQPDLVLQLAHHIAAEHRRRGEDVAVYADAWVSLNGRPPRRLIDPDVDLTQVADGLLPAEWILPGPTEPPPHLGGGAR